MKRMIRVLEFFWKRPLVSVWLVLAAASVLFISSIWLVEKGSVVDHPIRDLANREIVAEKKIKDSKIDLSNPVFFYMRCYPEITKGHLLALIQFQKKAEKFFGERGLDDQIQITSLASIVDYHSEYLGSFVSREKVINPEFDVRKWAQETLPRIEVDGALAGKVEGEYEYFIVGFFPPQDFSELEMYRLVRAFLKQEDLSIWELYLFPELKIHTSFFEVEGEKVSMTIDPIGWSEGRGEIDVQSNAETWLNIFGGIICLSGALLFVLLLPRQALVSLTVITIAFLTTRALIGVFDQFAIWFSGGEYRYLEDVFSILNSPASLIAGFSFPLRSFYKFNLEVRKNFFSGDHRTGMMSDSQYWDCWRNSFSRVFFALTLVTVIAVQDYINFMGLQQFHGSRSMWQVAVFSAAGISLSYFLTVVFLPPFYKLLGGRNLKPYAKRFTSLESGKLGRLSQFVDRVIGMISGFFLRRAAKGTLALPVVAFVVFVSLAVVMLGNGLLITDSKPEELLDPVPMGAVARELRKPGRPGFSVNQVSIEADLVNPEVLDKLWQYSMEMRDAGRTMFSPMNFFVSILLRDVPQYKLGGSIEVAIRRFVAEELGEEANTKKITEASKDFIRDVWNDILGQKFLSGLMRHFLVRDSDENPDPGQMIAVFTYEGVKATQMAAYVDLSYSKALEYGLEVVVPTKLAQYAEVDRLISQGPFNTPPPWGILLNDVMSQLSIVLIVFCVFFYLNTKNNSVRIRPLIGGILVAVPFVFSSMVVLLVMMAYKIPFDVASASIRSITVSVAVDLPIFLILGFWRLAEKEKGSFKKIISNSEMKHEANEVFVDALVNSLAFVFLIRVNFPTIHRIGIMVDVAMLMFFIATMWMVTPLLRYLVVSSEKTVVVPTSKNIKAGSAI